MSFSPDLTKIFISYRVADREANRVIDVLQEELDRWFGPVFWDKKSIGAGRWPEQIRTAVPAAEVVIVLIGSVEEWLGSLKSESERRIDQADDWVRWEVAAALEGAAPPSNKIVVPFLVSGENLPASSRLPVELQDLTNWQLWRLGSDPGWRSRETPAFCRWLEIEMEKGGRRRYLLRRLKSPLADVEELNRLVAPQSRHRIWAYFHAARGSLAEGEASVALTEADPIERFLEALDGLGGNEPLLRFLMLMLYRDQELILRGSKLHEAWKGEVNRARDASAEMGWVLEHSWDDLLAWANSAPLRPVFQIVFSPAASDRHPGLDLVATGTKSFGGQRRRLELTDRRLEWLPGLGDEELLERMEPVFGRILDEAISWLGTGISSWDAGLRPRVEIFLRRDQYTWPIDSALAGGKRIGAVFHVIRRLFERHFGSGHTEFYNEAWNDYRVWGTSDDRSVPVTKIALPDNWEKLRDWHEPTCAFALCEPLPEEGGRVLEDFICGLWLQASTNDEEDQPLSASDLVEALACAEETPELVRKRRIKPTRWARVAVLHDRPDHPIPYQAEKTAAAAPVQVAFSLLS